MEFTEQAIWILLDLTTKTIRFYLLEIKIKNERQKSPFKRAVTGKKDRAIRSKRKSRTV